MNFCWGLKYEEIFLVTKKLSVAVRKIYKLVAINHMSDVDICMPKNRGTETSINCK